MKILNDIMQLLPWGIEGNRLIKAIQRATVLCWVQQLITTNRVSLSDQRKTLSDWLECVLVLLKRMYTVDNVLIFGGICSMRKEISMI